MGSNREITLLLGTVCCLIIVCKHLITHTNAAPGQLHEERREFQSIQRSSKIIGGAGGIGSAGYYNSDSGQYEQELNTELDKWTKRHRDQVEGMAEKLRSEYNAALLTTNNAASDKVASSVGANNHYFQTSRSYVSSSSNTGGGGSAVSVINPNCNICAVLPSFTGKTQEELDIIAKNMTNQIISDMENGKLARSQINQPNWFENRVAQTLEELNKQKQSSSSAAVVYQQPIYHFDNAGTSGIQHQQSQQQSLFNQGAGHYQGQTQSQHSLYYAPSTSQRSRYFNTQSSVSQYPAPNPTVYQTTNIENRQRASDERSRSSVYQPRPIFVGSETIRTENNYSSSASSQHTIATPIIPVVHQNEYTFSEDIDEGQQKLEDFGQQQVDFGQTQLDYDRHEYDYTRNVNPTTTVPQHYDRSYFSQHHNTFETEEHIPALPRQTTPTPLSIQSQTINRTRIESTNNRDYVPIVVIPSQQTVISTSSVNVTEHERNHSQQPPVYRPIQRPSTTNTYHRQDETIDNERTQNRPAQPPYVNNINNIETYDHRHSEERTVNNNVNIQTPAPTVVTSSSKHSIYGYLDESSEYILPNYRPRVVIDKNSEFHPLDQRREPVQQQPQQHISTQKTSNQSQISRASEHNTTQHTTYIPQRPTYSEITRINTIQADNRSTLTPTVIYHQQPTYSETTQIHTVHTDNRDETAPTRIYPQRPSTITTHHTETIHHESSSSRNKVQPLVPIITIQTTEELSKYSREEYRNRLRHIQDELARLGYARLTQNQYNETIASGGFIHNGCQYVYNVDHQRYEKGKRIDVTETEYNEIFQRLRNQLNENHFGNMNELEINQTITTGAFLRGGYRWMYNTETQRFDRIQIDQDEREQIYNRIQEILQRMSLRQLTQRECQLVLYDGSLNRGGYRWLYNYINGMLVKSDYVGELSELTSDEYEQIYRRIQETLQTLGYSQMSERECNATITSGLFERGGIQWRYVPNSMTFERVTLSQEEYRQRLEILQQKLMELGYQNQLSGEEYRKIIYRGYFYNGAYRYQFNSATGKYDKLELTEQEYRDRVQKLQAQLQHIGYGTMSEIECNRTITNGLFHYGGYEWLYNGQLDTYVQGGRSTVDEPGLNERFDGNNVRDQTQYGSTADDQKNDNRRPTMSSISKNRGDQPPQHFDDDYESEENVEQEPGIGFYPTGEKRPEIQLAPPDIFSQVRVVSTPRPQPRPTPNSSSYYNAPLAPYRNEEERKKYEMHLQTQQVQVPVVAPSQQTDYERRYHRTQSTYTRLTDAGGQPAVYATIESPQSVASSHSHVNAHSEPKATPTEAYYRVGSEGEIGHRQINNRWGGRVSDGLLNSERSAQNSAQNVQLAKNASYSMGGSWSQSSNFNKDMETSGTPEEVQRRLDEFSIQNDDAQQLMGFNEQFEEDGQKLIDVGQQNEDLTQQNKNLNQQHEDLTQQREDLTQQREDYNQQREDFTQQQVNVANDWPHHDSKFGQERIETDVSDEKADVIEISPPVEKPSFWQRMKDKAKNLVG